ncbi:MAG: bi-domain-containing oxidoreductase [Chitinophagaceae bacterium]|jgi:predicted dehydrogenase
MKQIIQHLNSGETSLIDVPAPMVKEGHLLIQSVCSLVSAGTERMLIDFGRANWINKARQQPERVKAVFDKIKTDGLLPTIDAVKSKINKPIPLGYCNTGIVIGVGDNVSGFKIGDRVASNGPHAEIVLVPQNLCAKIPDNVDDESASFTVVGAVALQGIRLIQPSFGETVVVIGLGLIGQIAVQLLKANGCRVIGIDTDQAKCTLAEQAGIITICNKSEENIAASIFEMTSNVGADAVLITASSKQNEIIADAARMGRKRGRIVLVGVIGLYLNRADFYEKELTFQVSCSYGPGRYDFDYEKNSRDYPIGFVRWTAQRNFEAVLHAMSIGQLNVRQFNPEKIKLSEFPKAYDSIADKKNLASIFTYDLSLKHTDKIVIKENTVLKGDAVGLIGAGNFASKVIVPFLKNAKANIQIIASENGLSAAQVARQNNIPVAATNLDCIWEDNNINTVVIATQHNTHADLCIKALQSGKNVFVEKPLAITLYQLDAVKNEIEKSEQIIDVGFNRRHAPLAQKMKHLLGDHSAMNIVITVNAGKIPDNNWLNDITKSGGRIIGEVCHFIDLASFLCGSVVSSVCANAMAESDEDVAILFRFENGSSAAINYFSNGSKSYDKERIEVYSQGRTLVLENWKRLTGFGFKGFTSSSASQDKGHALQFSLLAKRIRNGGLSLIPFSSIYNTTKTAIAATESLRENRWVSI